MLIVRPLQCWECSQFCDIDAEVLAVVYCEMQVMVAITKLWKVQVLIHFEFVQFTECIRRGLVTYIPNTRHFHSAVRRAARYFWRNSRCLKCDEASSEFYYFFSIETETNAQYPRIVKTYAQDWDDLSLPTSRLWFYWCMNY